MADMLHGGTAPEFILFAQHGWADTHHQIAQLAGTLAPDRAEIVAPDLGWLNTWIRIEPLIAQVEAIAQATFARHPTLPARIVGHSMGGLIWLEILHRHPEWRSRVHSLCLVASPVGGAHLARTIDPFGWGIGIAADLAVNRRPIAEALATQIPILSIAGDVDAGSDGTVLLQTTQFRHAGRVVLPGLSHPAMKNHPRVAAAITDYWLSLDREPAATPWVLPASDRDRAIALLRAIPGMTDAHPRDRKHARLFATSPAGFAIHTWTNPLGVVHVFVTNAAAQCLFAGYVGWQHTIPLRNGLKDLVATLSLCPSARR